jgi:peptidoglycan hydrolase-like protein with peptidoglycan-binding domain
MQPTAPVAPVTIRDVQTALQQNGFYQHQNVDGVWGPRTERAVRAFQRAHHLTANGQLDVPTLQAMNLTGAPPSNAPSAAGSSSANGGNAPSNAPAGNQPSDNQQPDNTPPSATTPNMPSAPPTDSGNNNNNR